jgi:calcium-dependent protein kinase
MQKN